MWSVASRDNAAARHCEHMDVLRNAVPIAGARAENPCAACLVRQWAICQPLDDEALHLMKCLKSRDRLITAGSELYAEGEPLDDLFTILEGWLILYKLLEDGRRQITKVGLSGDFIGFRPDLKAPMDHSAQALTDVKLCVFPRETIMSLFREQPELAMRLTWLISSDIMVARERLTSLGRRTARERISYFLLELYYRVRLRHSDPVGTAIPLPLTQEHIGDALGLTSVHVNRTLRALREDNLIQVVNRTLHILDPDKLADAAGFDENQRVDI